MSWFKRSSRPTPSSIHADLRDEQKIRPLNHRAIRNFIKEALGRLLPGRSCRVSLLLVEDDGIRRFHAQYLKTDRPTDVMAFSQSEGRPLAGDASLLGDIVISTETAKRNARRFRVSFERELALCLVHGVLHLLGYDDTSPRKRKRMRQKEEELLGLLRKVVPFGTLVKR